MQSVAQLGRPSVAHATATGKVLLAYARRRAAARRRCAATRRGRSPTRARSRARSSASARADGPMPWASARTTSRRSPHRCGAAAASWPAIIGVQGPARGWTRRRRGAAASRSCSRTPLRSRPSSACRLGERSAHAQLCSGASQTRQPPRSRIRCRHLRVARALESARGSGPTTSSPGARSATSSSSASIGRGLQSRSRSTSTASESARVGRRAQRLLDLRGGDRTRTPSASEHRRRARHLGRVDDDQPLAASRPRHRRRSSAASGSKRRLERDEHHRPRSPARRLAGRRGADGPRARAHSGRSFQLGASASARVGARRRKA